MYQVYKEVENGFDFWAVGKFVQNILIIPATHNEEFFEFTNKGKIEAQNLADRRNKKWRY